jgi:predicted GNAT superfamily acetyltransferase
MLSVRPEARDRGIGRRLKLYHRSRLQAMGLRVTYWTYDPLVARNAHLNLNRVGATVEEYIVNLYGPGDQSPVDRVIGTDRFIVRWDLRPSGRRHGTLGPNLPARASGVVRIEIPSDIHALRDRDPQAALAWRKKTRRAYQYYLKRRYRVVGFYREGPSRRCFYLLTGR